MHFTGLRSLTQPCMTAYCIHHNTYDPGNSPGFANQCILGDVYLRSNLSREPCGELSSIPLWGFQHPRPKSRKPECKGHIICVMTYIRWEWARYMCWYDFIFTFRVPVVSTMLLMFANVSKAFRANQGLASSLPGKFFAWLPASTCTQNSNV